MNAKQVLGKILTVLSAKEEVLFTYARLADGTVVESPTFDLGETVEIVTEDGKSPAPNGYHDLELKDSEGNEVYIRVKTEDGKIVERENVEEAKPEAEAEFESIAGEDIGGEEDSTEQTDTAEPLTEDTDMKKVMQKLQYRIEEMEKKMQTMEELFPKPNEEAVSDVSQAEVVKTEKLPETMSAVEPDEEEELPKLDGAPIEEAPKVKGTFGKKTNSPQGTFLSKLYN
jgi:hypothetical protein